MLVAHEGTRILWRNLDSALLVVMDNLKRPEATPTL